MMLDAAARTSPHVNAVTDAWILISMAPYEPANDCQADALQLAAY